MDNQQSPYNHIFYLGLVKLETLNTYIEIYLANIFIKSSKSFIKALIFFMRKSDKNL